MEHDDLSVGGLYLASMLRYVCHELILIASFQSHFHVLDPDCNTEIEGIPSFPCGHQARRIFIIFMRALGRGFSLQEKNIASKHLRSVRL